MNNIIIGLIAFIIIYLIYWVTVILREKKLEKFKDNIYVRYLKMVYQVDIKQIPIKKLANCIALTNALIIAITLCIVSISDSIILTCLLAFCILIPLQLLCYHIIGKYYQKKQRRNHHVSS